MGPGWLIVMTVHMWADGIRQTPWAAVLAGLVVAVSAWVWAKEVRHRRR